VEDMRCTTATVCPTGDQGSDKPGATPPTNCCLAVKDKERLGIRPIKGLLKQDVLDYFSVPNTVQRNYAKVVTWHIDGRSSRCTAQGTQTGKFGLAAAL
jgi:hypothetical protein